MTSQPPAGEGAELLPVVQADRDAAEDIYLTCYDDPPNDLWLRAMLAGKHDDDLHVQAFARHRIASTPAPSSPDGVGEQNVAASAFLAVADFLRPASPLPADIERLVGKLKDLSDYFEPNDLTAATLIREAASGITDLAGENAAASRNVYLLQTDNAAMTEALATIRDRKFNCGVHQHGMAASELAKRILNSKDRKALPTSDDGRAEG